jgi:hypothetical protein
MARDFSGANALTGATKTPLEITGTAFTVAAWIFLDSLTSTNQNILRKISQGYILDIETTNVLRGVVLDGPVSFEIVNGNVLPTGAWTHVAVVKDGTGAGALRLYKNGALDGSATSNKSAAQDGSGIRIGGGSLDGKIAEGAVWAEALSVPNIARLAQGFSPLLIRPQVLRGYWPLTRSADEPDYMSGATVSVSGTVGKADHPRIIVPRPAIYTPYL